MCAIYNDLQFAIPCRSRYFCVGVSQADHCTACKTLAESYQSVVLAANNCIAKWKTERMKLTNQMANRQVNWIKDWALILKCLHCCCCHRWVLCVPLFFLLLNGSSSSCCWRLCNLPQVVLDTLMGMQWPHHSWPFRFKLEFLFQAKLHYVQLHYNTKFVIIWKF